MPYDGYYIAFLDQERYKVYPEDFRPPANAVIFQSPEEMARQVPTYSLNAIRNKLFNGKAVPLHDPQEAALALWITLLGDEESNVAKAPPTGPLLTVTGSRKFEHNSKRELMFFNYVRGVDSLKDHVLGKLLRNQAKAIIAAIEESGARVFTFPTLCDILEERPHLVRTVQPTKKLLKFHLCHSLYPFDVVRKIRYIDLIKHKRYKFFKLYRGNVDLNYATPIRAGESQDIGDVAVLEDRDKTKPLCSQ